MVSVCGINRKECFRMFSIATGVGMFVNDGILHEKVVFLSNQRGSFINNVILV